MLTNAGRKLPSVVAVYGRKPIPTETVTLVGLGVGAILVAWLIFSVFKKILGLLFLAAAAFGAWYLWNNPAMLQQVLGLVGA